MGQRKVHILKEVNPFDRRSVPGESETGTSSALHSALLYFSGAYEHADILMTSKFGITQEKCSMIQYTSGLKTFYD